MKNYQSFASETGIIFGPGAVEPRVNICLRLRQG